MRAGRVLRTRQKEALIKALVSGPAEDPNGRATAKLLDRMREYGYTASPTALSNFLKVCESEGLITRKLNVKRCYRIELANDIPEQFHDLLEVEEPTPVEEPATTEIIVEPKPEPTPKEIDPREVAIEMFNYAAELLTKDDWHWQQKIEHLDNQLASARQRVATLLEDNNRIRVKYSSAQDELITYKNMVGSLRAKINELEGKLSRERKERERDITRAIKEEARKQLSRLMTERPHQPASGAS